jgi:hypothetical protein
MLKVTLLVALAALAACSSDKGLLTQTTCTGPFVSIDPAQTAAPAAPGAAQPVPLPLAR